MTKEEEAKAIKMRQASCTWHARDLFTRNPPHNPALFCMNCGMLKSEYEAAKAAAALGGLYGGVP